jgi:excinuclease UvrABC nuclease subunit
MKTTVYRYYDAHGVLLYVGKSMNIVVRSTQHRGKPWFESVATITLEWFDDYWLARDAERRAIRDEHPLYNACRYTQQQRRQQQREAAIKAHEEAGL